MIADVVKPVECVSVVDEILDNHRQRIDRGLLCRRVVHQHDYVIVIVYIYRHEIQKLPGVFHFAARVAA